MRTLQAISFLCFLFYVGLISAIPLASVPSVSSTIQTPLIASNATQAPSAATPNTSTSMPTSVAKADRGPVIDAAFHITINSTCQGTQLLQVERALSELHRLITNATDELLQSPTSEISQLYWGPPKKSDLSTPIGVFHQLLYGSKKGVEIQCEKVADQCKDDKVKQAGGYVDKEDSSMHLCPDVFSGKDQRRFIEEICNDDWTLGDNQPHQYWSAVLLNLFLQSKQVTPNSLLTSIAWAYPNVLHLARLDPIASAHNIDTYLYFVLDHFAQQHISGGCRGVTHANLIKDKKTASAS